MTVTTTNEPPEVVLFAARHWGGEGVVPVERPEVTYGRMDVDGGRMTIPPGWSFRSDGFAYFMYEDDDTPGLWHWVDGSPWGAFATVSDGGDHWLVGGFEMRRVPK